MGKAFSCCFHIKNKINNQERDGHNERTRLLSYRTKTLYNKRHDWRNIRSQFRSQIGSMPELNEINGQNCKNNNTDIKSVEKRLAKNVVDITSIDRQMNKSEYNHRIKVYEKRMSRINKPLVLRSTITSQCLRTETPEHTYKHYNPIEVEDLELITYLSERASEAVNNGFKIDSTESVITPLNRWNRN